jgi:hypothetical protein
MAAMYPSLNADDASCLLYKKHKEEEKRERVKKMEEDYE